MTADDFRDIVLALDGAAEGEHMQHPDFRANGRIFASLHSEERLGMVKLTPKQQATFVEAEPNVFVPAKGAWGRSGSTNGRWRSAAPTRVGERRRSVTNDVGVGTSGPRQSRSSCTTVKLGPNMWRPAIGNPATSTYPEIIFLVT